VGLDSNSAWIRIQLVQWIRMQERQSGLKERKNRKNDLLRKSKFLNFLKKEN
jgi:hypothetical protein